VVCSALPVFASGSLAWAITPPSNTAAAIPTQAVPSQESTSSTSSDTYIKGGVQKTVKEAVTGLRAIYEASEKLKHSASELYGEATRQEVQLVEEPEYISGTVIEIPESFTTGPLLPMRKKWVDYYMAQITQLSTMLQDEIDGTLIPDDKVADCKPYMDSLNTAMADVEAHRQKLLQLTLSAPYDNQAIAMECKGISFDMKQIKELHKKLYHAVK
jgi:hypothetical protein